ncbi:ferredoxin--NADP reductase [Thioalkalivibrio paradoxus]|uniref:ferredoxin--NADP(+) reductase n=1 Tax=Thioalkalivibrio paradoxus ARh 1 TaxID=713585 RepID=W0DF91_9GAMM|nr:ferredoxin--NADP reductase [Thioalkalivibrio paradoxus]AHE97299.1 ferredoxin-NADP reductase [Thioalkalivibrio paradoxus ARh 1]
MSGWVVGEVTDLKRWTDRSFSLCVDAEVEPFRAGQYNRLRLVVDGEPVARPYSYVNPPGTRPLEFYLITVPGGPLSNRLIELAPGDTVELMPRSSGLFTLDSVPDAADLWLLATGTGLGPFLSMLGTDEPWQRFGSIRLVHSVRHANELTYQETIAGFTQRDPERFRYVPMISREDRPGLLRARIPSALDDGQLEALAGLEIGADHSQVMICGSPDMVRDTQAVLRARGLQRLRRGMPGQITVENYW